MCNSYLDNQKRTLLLLNISTDVCSDDRVDCSYQYAYQYTISVLFNNSVQNNSD